MTQDCPLDDLRDEKTPVSSFYPPSNEQRRSGPVSRSPGTISGHRPIVPRSSSRPQPEQPSVIVGPGVVEETTSADPQVDTVYMRRRHYARKLELALVALIAAIFAASITLLFSQTLAGGHSSETTAASPNRLAAPMLAVSLSPPPVFDRGAMDDRR